MQTGAATVENSMEFLKKLKMELPFDPVIPLLGTYPKNPETPTQKNICTCGHTSIFDNIQDLETAQVPTSRWGDKKAVVYLYNGILCGCKKRINSYLCDSTNGPGNYCAKANKSVRDRQIPYDLMNMWNLINKINEWTKQNQRHGYMEQTDKCQRGGVGENWQKKVKGLAIFFIHSFYLVEREHRERVKHLDTGANWPEFRSQFHYYSLDKSTSVPLCTCFRGLL